LVEGVNNLLDEGQVAERCRLIAKHRPKMVIVDTVAVGFPGMDENGSADMGRVVAVGRRLAEHGAAVILVHHDTKAGSSTPRGHSLLNGALDVSLHLTKDESGVIAGKLVKNRNGTCDLTIAFRIRAVSVGADEDGDTITAPTADELTGDAVRKGPKIRDRSLSALAVLRALVADGVRLPDGRRAVTETEWQDACDDKRVCCTSDNTKSRTKAFQRAYKELLDASLIVTGAGRVSLAAVITRDFPV
jgi:hypothetical protein